MRALYFFFREETTFETARRVAALPAVPAFGAAFTDRFVEEAWLNVFAAADLADLEALGLLSVCPARWVAVLLGTFLVATIPSTFNYAKSESCTLSNLHYLNDTASAEIYTIGLNSELKWTIPTL